jgi:membrane protease YdiL (CAAX protease family)
MLVAMFDLIDHWIDLPLSYALTVGGLVMAYRHVGVPAEGRLLRALWAGVPVMVGVAVLWGCAVGIAEIGIDPRPFRGLTFLMGIPFFVSASALAGAFLARRELPSVVD